MSKVAQYLLFGCGVLAIACLIVVPYLIARWQQKGGDIESGSKPGKNPHA